MQFEVKLTVNGEHTVFHSGFPVPYLNDFNMFFKDLLTKLKNDININVIFASENNKEKLTYNRLTKRKVKQLTSAYNYFDQKTLSMIKEQYKYESEEKLRELLRDYKEKTLVFTSYFNGKELYIYEMNMNRKNFQIEKLYSDQFLAIMDDFMYDIQRKIIDDQCKTESDNFLVWLEWTEDYQKTMKRLQNLGEDGITREYIVDKVKKGHFTPQLKNKFYQVSEAKMNPDKPITKLI